MIKKFRKRDGNMVFIINTDNKTFVKASMRLLKGNRVIWQSKKATVEGPDKFDLKFGVRLAIRKLKLDIEGQIRAGIDRILRKQIGWIRAGKVLEDTVIRQAAAKRPVAQKPIISPKLVQTWAAFEKQAEKQAADFSGLFEACIKNKCSWYKGPTKGIWRGCTRPWIGPTTMVKCSG